MAQDQAIGLALRDAAGGWMKRIYAARGYRPLWVTGDRVGPQADTLIGWLDGAAGGLADAVLDRWRAVSSTV